MNSSNLGQLYKSTVARKVLILLLIGGWLVVFSANYEKVDWKSFIALSVFLMLYLFEVIYSLTTSSNSVSSFNLLALPFLTGRKH